MQQKLITETFYISGMTCTGCERIIQTHLSGMPGVQAVQISYQTGRGTITYAPEQASSKQIMDAVSSIGYSAAVGRKPANSKKQAAGILLLVFALSLLVQGSGITAAFNIFPQAEQTMSYGMLFVIGLFTSVHCIAMCGGLGLSQCLSGESCNTCASLRPSLLYNSGRVLSYAAVGAVIGAVGTVFQLSGFARGAVQLIAGIFMVLMGMNMLGLLPWLRRLAPKVPAIFKQSSGKGRGALALGLVGGFMPCGPLQAMQLYALSTGSAAKGALAMLLFGLGTLPLMFAFGAVSSILSRKYTKKILMAGSALVVVLGVSMFGNGLALSGVAWSAGAPLSESAAHTDDGVQTLSTDLHSGRYPPITVSQGTPVRWTIHAAQGMVNGCNYRIILPEYGTEQSLETGENIIEFTPENTGTFVYTCWMGMIRSSITVLPAGEPIPADTAEPQSYGPENYNFSTDAAVSAKIQDGMQYIANEMLPEAFSPAVLIMQSGVETAWSIEKRSPGAELIYVPLYDAELLAEQGQTTVYLVPNTDFAFFSQDGSFSGYVKVVDNIEAVDTDAVLAEVAQMLADISQ